MYDHRVRAHRPDNHVSLMTPDGSETLVGCCSIPEQGHDLVGSRSTAGLAGDVGASPFRPIGAQWAIDEAKQRAKAVC